MGNDCPFPCSRFKTKFSLFRPDGCILSKYNQSFSLHLEVKCQLYVPIFSCAQKNSNLYLAIWLIDPPLPKIRAFHTFIFSCYCILSVLFSRGLDMASFAHPGIPTDVAIYDLRAVCTHYGFMNFGHYIAFCKPYSKDELDILALTKTDGECTILSLSVPVCLQS